MKCFKACIQERGLQSRSISWHVRRRVAIGSANDKISMGRDFSPMMRVLASDPGACAISIKVEQWSPSQDRGDVNEFHSMLATLMEAVPASAICKDVRKSVNDEEHSSYTRVKTCFAGCRFDVSQCDMLRFPRLIRTVYQSWWLFLSLCVANSPCFQDLGTPKWMVYNGKPEPY